MPDIFQDLPARRLKPRWSGGSLSNDYFGSRRGLFYGSTVAVDANDEPIMGTEKRAPELDFSVVVADWQTTVTPPAEEGGQPTTVAALTPTADGLKMVTFTDPVTGLEHTVSYIGVMNAMSEVISTEGKSRFFPT
jgi:hypothetical protein